MGSLGEAVLDLSGDSSRLNATLDDAKSRVQQVVGNMKTQWGNVTSSLSSIGNTLTRSFTVPVLATMGLLTLGGGQAIRTYADFEKQMSGVQAVLGATKEEAQALKDLAINLGLDPKLIVSTSQAAQVFEELAKNGLTADEILGGAARSAIALANATGTDFPVAAEIASTAMQLFNLKAEDMEKVVNNVTGVANASRFTVEDYAQALAMGGGVAAQMKIPIDDFSVAIAGLSTSFSSGSDAGTSFKTFLQRLAPDTAPAIDAMKELGIITEEDGNRFFDSEGNMKSLSEIAGILQEAFKGLSDEQRILAMTNIFGTDAMRAAGAMAGLGAEGFNKLAESMAKTDAAANAATRMDNIAGDIEILKGVVEGFQIKFVDVFKDKLREPIQVFTTFLSENKDKISAILEKLATVLGDMGTSLAEGIKENGPQMLEFFEKMVDALPKFIDKVVEVATVVGPHLQKLFDVFMSMKPETLAIILEVIAALAVLGPVLSGIAGVMTFLASLGTLISGVVGFFGGFGAIFSTITTVLVAFGSFITATLIPAIVSFVAAFWPVILIVGLVIAAIALLFLAWKNNFLGMGDGINAFVSTVKSLWQALLAFLRGDTDAAMGHLKQVWETLVQNSVAQTMRLRTMVMNIWTGLTTFLRTVWQNAWTAIVSFLQTKANDVMGKVKDLIGKIKSAFNINWSELAKRIIDGLITGLRNGARAVADAARQMAQGAINAAKNVLGINSDSTVFTSFGNFSGSGFVNGMQRAMVPQSVGNIFNRAASGASAGTTNNRSVSNVINVYNPSPEATSNSVDKTLKKLSYLGVIK